MMMMMVVVARKWCRVKMIDAVVVGLDAAMKRCKLFLFKNIFLLRIRESNESLGIISILSF
jgi:hypothetical protein